MSAWHQRSTKTKSFGLPFGIVVTVAVSWFCMTALHHHSISPESLGATVGSAATQSVALLDNETDFHLADSGAQNRRWSEPVADSSQHKADPARDPFLDSTPIHVARRTPHRHARAKHHQKALHHHH